MRSRLTSFFSAFVAALAVLWAAGGARAQSLAIEPVVVQLAPGQMAATLTLVNQSPAESAFQVRAFAWRADDAGMDDLTPTDRVVLSPPLGTIAPNQRQLIRVVLRDAPRDREATYRIWIDQIPPAGEPGSVRVALRLSIPIFALPAQRVAPDLGWRLTRSGDTLVLTASNSGTRHQTVRNLVVTAPGGAVLKAQSNSSPYVLAGGLRRWVFPMPAQPPASIRLTAATGDGPLETAVPLTPAP